MVSSGHVGAGFPKQSSRTDYPFLELPSASASVRPAGITGTGLAACKYFGGLWLQGFVLSGFPGHQSPEEWTALLYEGLNLLGRRFAFMGFGLVNVSLVRP